MKSNYYIKQMAKWINESTIDHIINEYTLSEGMDYSGKNEKKITSDSLSETCADQFLRMLFVYICNHAKSDMNVVKGIGTFKNVFGDDSIELDLYDYNKYFVGIPDKNVYISVLKDWQKIFSDNDRNMKAILNFDSEDDDRFRENYEKTIKYIANNIIILNYDKIDNKTDDYMLKIYKKKGFDGTVDFGLKPNKYSFKISAEGFTTSLSIKYTANSKIVFQDRDMPTKHLSGREFHKPNLPQ